MSDDSLGISLSKVLLEHMPKLLDGDMQANAAAASALADVLGAIMAAALLRLGQDGFEECLDAVCKRIRATAESVALRAIAIDPNTTEH